MLHTAQDDWQLASMICKILWNFGGGLADPHVIAADIFGESESEDIVAVLTAFLGMSRCK